MSYETPALISPEKLLPELPPPGVFSGQRMPHPHIVGILGSNAIRALDRARSLALATRSSDHTAYSHDAADQCRAALADAAYHLDIGHDGFPDARAAAWSLASSVRRSERVAIEPIDELQKIIMDITDAEIGRLAADRGMTSMPRARH